MAYERLGREYFEDEHGSYTVIGFRYSLMDTQTGKLAEGLYLNDLTVEIYGPRVEYGRTTAAEINWSGIGSVKKEQAREYAKLIFRAVEIAEKMDSKREAVR